MEAGTAVLPAGVDLQGSKHDAALDLLTTHHIKFDPESPEAIAVRKKIDRRLMPLLYAVYLLQLIDKNTLSFAAIMGIRTKTHLTASQYSWLGSLVYFGYLGGDVPATYLMQRFPLDKYLGVACMIWGLVVLLHAACHDFGGLAALRFLLGWVEVCTAPATIIITSNWYTKKEQVVRVGIWYTCSGMASIVGGFVAYLFTFSTHFGWQGLYILWGSLTFITGVCLYFFLAPTPGSAKWLTEDEKVIALERVRENKTGSEIWKHNPQQIKEAFCDPRLYLFFLILVATGVPNGGITAFGPTIINSFGFTTRQSTLLSMAPGAASVVCTLLSVPLARKTSRAFAGLCTIILSIIGTVMMFTIPAHNHAARYGGYVLCLLYAVCIPAVIAFITAGVGGSTKKFLMTMAYQLGYAVGNIIGPQTYRAKWAPNYYPSKYIMLAFIVFTGVLLLCFEGLHYYWNRQADARDAADAAAGIVHEKIENEEFLDRTDFQIRSFRYPL
ncbi:MFS general substrate transporter [Meredithblackwellia eburnea MCA 4105]